MRSRPSTQACLTRACAEVMQGPGACVAMYACSPHMRAAHVVCEGSAAAARTCVPGRRSDAPSFVVTTHSCACRRSSMPAHAAGVVGADKVPRVERVFVDAACEAQRLSASQRASHARRTARSQAIASVSPQAQGGRPYTPPWHWALMHRSMCALRRAGRASDHRPQLHHPHRVLEEHVLDAVQPALPAQQAACGAWVRERVLSPQHRRKIGHKVFHTLAAMGAMQASALAAPSMQGRPVAPGLPESQVVFLCIMYYYMYLMYYYIP